MSFQPALSICLPFYMNPGMLSLHYAEWASWPEPVKDRVELVIVDDGSPTGAAIDVPRPAGLPALSLCRVVEDIAWHQDGARNLGAKVARGQWLLLTDMDHMIRLGAVQALLARVDQGRLKSDAIYTLARVEASSGLPTRNKWGFRKPHPNSFVLTRERYWIIGGYDEDLCGVYGTDAAFRWRAFRKARRRHLGDIALARFPRSMAPDASTTTLSRKSRDQLDEMRRRFWPKRRLGVHQTVPTLQFAYERQL